MNSIQWSSSRSILYKLKVSWRSFSFLSVRDVMQIRLPSKQWNQQWNQLIDTEFKFNRVRSKKLVRSDDRYPLFKENENVYFKPLSSFDYTCKNAKFCRVKYLQASLCLKYAELEDAFDFLKSFKALKETRCRTIDRSTVRKLKRKRSPSAWIVW